MIVFRLSKAKYSHDLSGKGAEKAGGRWNSKGTALLYTSESRALCTTEVAVHLPLGIIPTNYELVTLDVPNTVSIRVMADDELPGDWGAFPPTPTTQAIGDQFVDEGMYVILKVPSVVIPGDFNYLLNPSHPDFSKIKLLPPEPFRFDTRLFKR